MHILIHPEFDALYYSYYFSGLKEAFPEYELRFGTFPCPGSRNQLRFIVPLQREWRIALCAMDTPAIDTSIAEWAHYYGKVNVSRDEASMGRKYVHPLGPSFGIKAWGALESVCLAASTLPRIPCGGGAWMRHVKDIYRQWRHRLSLRHYEPAPSSDKYIFFAGSLWKREPSTNSARAAFVRACKRLRGLVFEGGLAPRRKRDIEGYEDILLKRRYELREYIQKVKISAVAFNTPGVMSCLGWKLAEFLALRKAIVSLPLEREMPAPLAHGRHIHFIQSSAESEIRDAVEKIVCDREYRRRLETGARQYFDEWLSPRAVAVRIRRFLECN